MILSIKLPCVKCLSMSACSELYFESGPIKPFFRVTVSVSEPLGLMLLHDSDSGAQLYSLTEHRPVGVRNSEARLPSLAFPVAFVPRSSYAILGDTGMESLKPKFTFSKIPLFRIHTYFLIRSHLCIQRLIFRHVGGNLSP